MEEQKKEIDNKFIKKAGDLAEEAFIELNKLQQGNKKILKFGREMIDCHIGGLLPSDVVLVGGQSGIGKTKFLHDTINFILSEEVNKRAKNYVSLEFSLEMKFFNKILRESNKLTGKKKRDIISEAFTEEEQKVISKYYKDLQDNRRFVVEETINTSQFFQICRDFCEFFKDKEGIVISLDHVLLVNKTSPGENTAEVLTQKINDLRKEYKNVYFILLSQLNRTSQEVIKDKNNGMIPRSSMIFGSSHFEFLSSYIIGIMNPFKMGVNQFLKVNADRYDWLSKYFGEQSPNGKISFETLGNMFYFVMKTRESDLPYKNLFIDKMDLTEEQLELMRKDVKEDTIEVPTFEPKIENIPFFGEDKENNTNQEKPF